MQLLANSLASLARYKFWSGLFHLSISNLAGSNRPAVNYSLRRGVCNTWLGHPYRIKYIIKRAAGLKVSQCSVNLYASGFKLSQYLAGFGFVYLYIYYNLHRLPFGAGGLKPLNLN